jgi:hypothetical protein
MDGIEIVSKIVLPILAILIAAVGGGIGIHTYWRNSQTRRAEWLCRLYEKFYEGDHYRKVRRILDYEPKEELTKLCDGLTGKGDAELAEQLVDYLNFFEFIASLWAMKQLSLREIRMLFQYYLELNARHEPVFQFIKTQGFENLDKMMTTLKSS